MDSSDDDDNSPIPSRNISEDQSRWASSDDGDNNSPARSATRSEGISRRASTDGGKTPPPATKRSRIYGNHSQTQSQGLFVTQQSPDLSVYRSQILSSTQSSPHLSVSGSPPPTSHQQANKFLFPSSREGSDRWDSDLDDDSDRESIASIASDELNRTRPNRWRGGLDHWLRAIDRERRLQRSLSGLAREDLSAHLYNYHNLREMGKREARGEKVWEDGEDGEEGQKKRRIWLSKVWSAWPLREDKVPQDSMLPEALDYFNDPFTTRGEAEVWPSEGLEGEIGAVMLRVAKERFLKRKRGWEEEEARGEREGGERDVAESVERDLGGQESEEEAPDWAEKVGDKGKKGHKRKEGVESEPAEGVEIESGNAKKKGEKAQEGEEEFVPTVSADDDLSYAFLRPATRRIMARLDDTFTIMHNSRRAAGKIRKYAASSASEGESTRIGQNSEDDEDDSPSEESPKKSNKRPRKKQRREEEEDDDDDKESQSETESIAMSTSTRSRSTSAARVFGASDRSQFRRAARWPLRDWRDVMAAAAMAGFSPSVMARATQRCSTLFDQDMTLWTIPEKVKTEGEAFYQPVKYTPNGPPIESSDEEDTAELERDQLRALICQTRAASPESDGAQAETPAKRPKSAAKGSNKQFFCPHPACPRAVQSFTKRSNLDRHLKTMHPHEVLNANVIAKSATEIASGDERVGVIHRDRFLKPIKTRQGWRGADKNPEAKKNRSARVLKRTKLDQKSEEFVVDSGSEDNPLMD